MPTRRGGRPRSPESRPDRATVRFTKIEYLAVKRRAATARLTVAEYCRQAVLTGRVTPTLDPAALPALHEMRALANTLNQLVNQARGDGMRSVAIKADGLLDQLTKLLAT
ncbi:plasmid mobilization protein [Hymenobacter defluvii]|uniref:plasmid mobilization protein n=1 Tax=Hymenobacter defluvii TaxID=2054411 RepID=UPI001AAE6BBD|nr:plasmid mobilization relaxosome protein MobC [Hymenobacter defluvii]